MDALPISSIIFGFLLGAIPFGFVIARAWGVRDIRQHGSGNIGATNVWRVVGKTPGIVTLALDIAKGVAAVALVSLLVYSDHPRIEIYRIAAGMAAILGHMFTPFLGFKGGKGVNTALGVFVTLMPLETGIALIVFIATVWMTRYVSLGSMSAALTVLVVVLIRSFALGQEINVAYITISVALFILIVFAHRKNISRLVNGSENKFSFKR